MIRQAAVVFLLLFSADAAAAQPTEPTEEMKILALKLGYAINGNSMVRWGSIDLTAPDLIEPHALAPVRVIPTEEPKKKKEKK